MRTTLRYLEEGGLQVGWIVAILGKKHPVDKSFSLASLAAHKSASVGNVLSVLALEGETDLLLEYSKFLADSSYGGAFIAEINRSLVELRGRYMYTYTSALYGWAAAGNPRGLKEKLIELILEVPCGNTNSQRAAPDDS